MAQAVACYDALFVEGQRLGFLPYRMSPQNMPRYTAMPDSVFLGSCRHN